VIELKEAVAKAFEAFREMSLVPESTPVELEEAELEEDGTYWLVTFSYPESASNSGLEEVGPNLRAMLRNRRAYKALRLLSNDGSVRGIKSIHA